MMRKFCIFLLVALFVAVFSYGQVPRLEWASSIQGSGQKIGYSIGVDGGGNVYTLGSFFGTADFDPGASAFSLTSNGSSDIFIVKQNADGNFVWALQFGGDDFDEALSMAVDNAGQIHVGGYFNSSIVDFDPGPGNQNLTNAGAGDAFLLKLDTDGNLLWVEQISGSDDELIYSIALDPDGSVVSTGYISGTTDFDGGSGTFELTSASPGVSDIFIAKHNSSGDLEWAKAIGTVNYENAFGVTVDALKNVIIVGDIPSGSIDVDPGTGVVDLIPTGSSNGLILKLNELGDFVWAKVINGDASLVANSVATDNLGNVLVGGTFEGSPDFDPDAGVFTIPTNGVNDAFLLKLQPDGSFSWAINFGTTNYQYLYSVTTDASRNVIATGQFEDDVDFDPGTGTAILSPVGVRDVFLLKLDESGNYVWAGQMGGTSGNEFAYDVITDAADNIYSTGYFEGLGDFDPSLCEYNLVAIDNFDVYMVKVGTAATTCTFVISQQPQPVTTCLGGTASFTVEAVGTTNIQYQWQVFNDGLPGYIDLSDNVQFSGTNTPTLTITNANLSHDEEYRCKISGDGFADIFSIDVKLTVIAPPVAPNVSRCGAGLVTLTAEGGTNGQYRWYTTASGGTPIAGESNSSFTTPSLSTSTTYYVSIDLGTCETNRTAVTATINSCAPIPELVWAKSFGGNGYSLSMITDAAGNVYTIGFFRGSTDFDPGPGTTTLTSLGGSIEAYISKLDPAGNLVWAKAVGGVSDEQGNSIALDGSGNIYVAGIFRGTADFDPGPGTSSLTPNGGYDVFILKLDLNGDFVWVKQIGGTSLSGDGVSSIQLDDAGNVWTYGSFYGTVDFNPGAGISNLTSAGQTDIFISQLDGDGNFISAHKFGGTNFDLPGKMFIDDVNEIYCTGYFRGTSDLDPGAGTFNVVSAGVDDVFISKLNAAGNFVWAKQVGGAGDERGTALAKDGSGNIILTGYYENTLDLDPGTGISEFTSLGQSDVFIIKLTSLGDYLWGKSIGGLGEDRSQSLTFDSNDNILIAGSFYQTVDFDPGPGTFSITSFGQQDGFVVKLTSNGDYFWSINMGGLNSDFTTGISLDAAENIYTSGGFRGDGDFDPGPGITTLTADGSSSTFAQRLVSPTIVINIDSQPADVSLCNGQTATLQTLASGTTNLSYQWQFSPDGTTFADISDGTNYSGTASTTLTVNTSGNFGEGWYRCLVNGDFASTATSNEANLTISPEPTPPAVTGNSICNTGSVMLSASGAGAGQYRWYPSMTDPAIAGEVNSTYTTPVLTSTTSFFVSIHDGSCESIRVEVIATVNPLPAKPTITSSITPVAGSVIVCDAASLNLSAPTGFTSYTWSSGETTDQINVTVAGSYTVTVTDAAGCFSPLSDPIIVITDTTPASPTVTNASLCGSGAVTLSASGGTNGNYRWYDVATGGTALAGEVNSTYTTPALTTSTTYYVSITNGNCESNRVAVTATISAVPAQPVITSSITPIGNAISICSTTPLTLSAPAGFSYLWSEGSTTQQITVTASGSYSVVVSSGGCSSPASEAIDVTIIPAPCNNQPPVITTSSLTTTIGSLVTLNLLTLISDPDNNLVAASLAIVQGPTSGAIASIASGILTIDYAGLNFAGTDFITIEVCDAFGECTQEQLEINVIGEIEIYNAVSPNNDGMNEFFDLRYIDLLPDTQENKVTIYNRWGTVVFEVENYKEANAFRGLSSNGTELPSGTYFYKIEFTRGRSSITGYLSLKR
jgi:gliding motility-associated-like protein